jgi:hypothetical protein
MFRAIIAVAFACLLGTGFCIAQGNSLLWRISGNGMKQSSYLYGTMHSTDRRVFHFADSVLPALETCESFAMEVVMDETAQQLLLTNIFMSGTTTIRSLLTSSQYDSLQRFAIRHASVNISDFDRMKPLYVAMMLEMMAADDSMINTRDPFLDQYLEKRARQQQKRVTGLETAGEQMTVFDALSYPDQAALLMKTVREFSNDTSGFQTMLQHYLNNDLTGMMAFENDLNIPDSLYDALITIRNVKMAARIDTLVRTSSFFIAVGAGHLGGEQGLVSLLRAKNYTVVPVIPAYDSYLPGGWYRFVSTHNQFTIEFPKVPEITVEAGGSSVYTAAGNVPSGKQELFTVHSFSPDQTERVFEEVSGRFSYFTFNPDTRSLQGRSGKMKAYGKILCSNSVCYLLLHEYHGKPKYGERFFQSFAILAP